MGFGFGSIFSHLRSRIFGAMNNDSAASEWDSKAAEWVHHREIYDRAFAAVTDAVLERADIRPGQRVLDVGCGAGTLLARAQDLGAHPCGVDISEPMVAAARERVPGATVAVADAEEADLLAATGSAPFDRIVSRFGVMFFADAGAAFANLRRAAAPGARIAFATWHHSAENIFRNGLRRVAAALPEGTLPPTPGIDSPGPLGLATAAKIGTSMTPEGWVDVKATPLTVEIIYGTAESTGVDERMQIALAGNTGRALREAVVAERGENGWADALDTIRAEISESVIDGHVRFTDTVWIVSALNPAS